MNMLLYDRPTAGPTFTCKHLLDLPPRETIDAAKAHHEPLTYPAILIEPFQISNGREASGLHVATQSGEISPSPTIEMPGRRGAQRPPVPVSPVEEIVLTGLPWSAPVGYLVLLESSLFQPADGPFVHEGFKILVDGFDLTTIEATSKRRSRFIDESVAAQMLRFEADRVLEI